jgi:hypothetical protein
MDADKKARIARIVGFICLGLAFLNATFAVLAMVAEKDVHRGIRGLATTVGVFVVGLVCLDRSK